MNAITLAPVGVIHTPFASLAGMPIQSVGSAGAAGWIELDTAYTAGLRDLEGFEYLILTVCADVRRARPSALAGLPVKWHRFIRPAQTTGSSRG